MTNINVGIDIGGTFTDIVFLDDLGNRFFGKTLTTYPDPSEGFLKGLNENLNKYGFSYNDIKTITHGTTLVVNALIERKGAKTALIGTKGFRDQLEIGTEGRFDLYDLFIDKPTPLVPRNLRYSVSERILSDGFVFQELNIKEVEDIFKELTEQEVESVAVCLIHGYKNGIHERKIKEIGNRIAPHIRISISSEVSPEIREQPRMSTTIANVYVQPLVEKYLTNLEKILKDKGFKGNFHMMLSGGGTCTIETACKLPILILESGPVGGTQTAVYYGELCNFSNLLVFDMGGTTAKASLIDNGKPIVTNDFEVGREHRFMKGSGLPIKVPVIEMIEIGAGGGSIAHIDDLGLLKVGPESASSVPGPACYGKGGEAPTITDADLILGYLNPDFFLGGEMKLDKDKAYKVIKEKIADPLNIEVAEAAFGIHRIVNENMASAARIHAIEKGKDIRNYSLFASGGAGPVHASNVANILDLSRVISPVGSGVSSAFGFLSSPLAFDFVRSYPGNLDKIDINKVTKLFKDMEKEGETMLLEAGVDINDIYCYREGEMRYEGQTYEIKVPIPNGELNTNTLKEIKKNFIAQYKKLYAEANENMSIEVMNWRTVVQGPKPNLPLNKDNNNKAEHKPKENRCAYFNEYKEYILTPVYNRNQLQEGFEKSGPAIIEERESTIIVSPKHKVSVDSFLNLILDTKKDDINDN